MCSSISTSVKVASVVATFVMRLGQAGGGRIVAGLAEVDLVAFPAGAALGRVSSVGVIRRTDPLSAGREVFVLPPGHLLPGAVDRAVVLRDPHPPQDDDRGNLAQPRWRVVGMDGLEQVKSVSAWVCCIRGGRGWAGCADASSLC